MPSNPQPVINVSLRKYIEGNPTPVVFNLYGRSLTSFEWNLPNGMSSSSLTIGLIDYTAELGDRINLHQFNPNEYIEVWFQIGHTESIWEDTDGKAAAAITGELKGTVATFTPKFASGSGIEIELVVYGLKLNSVLKTVNSAWAIPADVTTLREAYKAIAEEFSIDIRTSQGKGLEDLDDTDFTGGKKDLKLLSKEAGVTGMDYLKMFYSYHPPTIAGKAVFTRFNPFGNDGNGVFEIIPAESSTRIKRVYRWNGDGSKVISFAPILNPFKALNNLQGVQYKIVDSETKKGEFKTDDQLSADDVYKLQIAETTDGMLSGIARKTESNYLKYVLNAVITIIGDIGVIGNDVVQVEVYNKLSGYLLFSQTFSILNVKHYFQDGVFLTDLELTRASVKPILSQVVTDVDEQKKLLNDANAESALNKVVDLYAFLGVFNSLAA